MKMKVIDLLNKIANGEEVPKKIKLNGTIFVYQGDDYLYEDKDRNECWLFSENYTNRYNWLECFLRDEIEIIDEDKKIEKLERHIPQWEGELYCTKYNEVADKINEIIEEIEKIKDDRK